MFNETAKTPSKSSQNANLTEAFHVKSPRLAFSFLPPVRFEISLQVFLVGFLSFLSFTD